MDTLLIHGGERSPRVEGAITLPIFQSSTYESGADDELRGVRYIRNNNTPNHEVLRRKLAILEGGEAAAITASGMAAILSTLLALLSAGDHVMAHRTLYGGTFGLLTHDLPRLGIECTLVDAGDSEAWDRARRPNTRAFYVETMSNPLLDVVDLDAVVSFCKTYRLVSVIDNTFATPINYRPLEHGFDIAVHSATKYLNGHSDIVAGAVVGAAETMRRVDQKVIAFGATLDPHACFLLHRGLKTLALRVRQQNANAQAVAEFLSTHPSVKSVYYPGLEGDRAHARAQRWFAGCGGLLSFELAGGVEAADALLAGVELATCAPSLGGAETLMTRPSRTSHAALGPEERQRQGIAEGLVRLAVGLESVEDLIADFSRALNPS